MSDLEGIDAFTHVVDRLIEEGAKARRDEDARRNLEHKINGLNQQIEKLQSALTSLKVDKDNHETQALPKLRELHLAATAYLGLTRSGGEYTAEEMAAARTRLDAALKEACPHCDEISF